MADRQLVPVSVLMSVYFRDDPGQLALALGSMTEQTSLPSEFVVVVGGTLPLELESVLANAKESHPEIGWRVIQQQTNEGLGSALKQGLENCSNEFVARMDGDDLSRPNRIAVQYAYMTAHPDIDLLCSWHEEFAVDPSQVHGVKCTPATDAEIKRVIAWRNVISHPSLFMRRSRVLSIGGYRPLRRSEDHDLYVRARCAGLKFACIEKPLVWMRVDRSQRVRRTGFGYAFGSVAWRTRLLLEGNISPLEWAITAPLYLGFHLLPPGAMPFVYRFVRRRPAAVTAPRTEAAGSP